MKCHSCKTEFFIETLPELFFYQDLCNNCNNLFQYTRKNGKIKSLVCNVYFLKYYENIMYYTNEENYGKMNSRLLKAHRIKNKYYTVKTISDLLNYGKFRVPKKLVIVFVRQEFKELLKIIKIIIEQNEIRKISLYELIK